MIANNSDKISKMTRDVVIEPAKNGATVTLDMYFKHPENIKEMTIERGTVLGEEFRQIKTFASTEIATIADGKYTAIDKYPVSGNEGVYYRVAVIDKDGVMRYYPASEMQSSMSASAE
jgi:CHASE2 domain-containing sensor protein